MLHRSLPGCEVRAEHYPPSHAATMLSGAITVGQFAVIGAALGGQAIADAVAGTAVAEAVRGLQENRLAAAGGAWFIGSSLSASMTKTGAFEVMIRGADDEFVVWSGIKHGGRPPATLDEMNDIIESLRAAGAGRGQGRAERLDASL